MQTREGPRTVAVLGASAKRHKFGNKAVRAFVRQGYQVFPINLHERIIEGLTVYQSLHELPGRPELVSVYLPPETTLRLLPEIAARGCDELWLNPGSESAEVLARAEQLGLNVIQACSIVGAGVSPGEL